MLSLVSSSRGIEPIEVLPGLLHLGRRRPVLAELPRPPCRSPSIARSTFLGIDAGAHHQRTFADCRIERAERVIGHPLTFANVVGEPAAEPELTEDVVHHPVRVVAGIEPADRGEPVCDVGLRLAGHVDRCAPAGEPEDGRRRNDDRRAGARRPPVDLHSGARRCARAASTSPTTTSDSTAGRTCRAWKAGDRPRGRCARASRPSLRPAAVRMRRAVQQFESASTARTAGLSSSCRSAVIDSARRFASSSSGNVGRRATSMTIASTSSKSSARHVQESVSRVPRRRDAQRDAALVELLGNRIRRPRARFLDRSRARQVGEAGQRRRVRRGCRQGTWR